MLLIAHTRAEEFSNALFECEYAQKTWWRGVNLSETMLTNVRGGAFIWVWSWSTNIQGGCIFELEYNRTCRRGVYLSYNLYI